MVLGVWRPWMRDRTDLGGSADWFAGDGVNPIQRVEAYIGDAQGKLKRRPIFHILRIS